MNEGVVKKILYGDGMHDDTEIIQKMLDNGGYVYLPAGKYLVTRPLIIHSNTHFCMDNTTTLKLADGANCSILDNDGLYNDTVNENITVEGGIWDGNNLAQQRKKIPNEGKAGDENEDKDCDKEIYISNVYLVLMLRFIHVKGLTLKNLTLKDPTSFAVQIADADTFTVENIRLDYNLKNKNMDGIHIQGPARFGYMFTATNRRTTSTPSPPIARDGSSRLAHATSGRNPRPLQPARPFTTTLTLTVSMPKA